MDLTPASDSVVGTASPLTALIVAAIVFVLIVGALWWYLNRMKPRRQR